MTKFNCNREGCKDVFKAYLVSNARYSFNNDLPIISISKEIPDHLISFSKALKSRDYNAWVHFYEDDYLFERIWNNPKKYVHILKKFRGVILPDFSLYRDMPIIMQKWNIYRSRAIGNYFQANGIKVIPNIRFGDQRTVKLSCEGIKSNSIISIGTYGSMKCKIDRDIMLSGIDEVIRILKPSIIIVYGSLPKETIDKINALNIQLIIFNPLTGNVRGNC